MQFVLSVVFTVFMMVWAKSSTARREFGSTPSTAMGAPKVTNARDLYPTANLTISATSRLSGRWPRFTRCRERT